MPGHHVLAVPVPELEEFVRGRWQHYDDRWVSTDPAFTHAHVTALAPYLSAPTAPDLQQVAEIAAATASFDFELAQVATFPNGCIHARPDPSAPFADLTRRLVAAFPTCPPYGGEYDAVPHLTLDQRSATVTEVSTRAALASVLPVTCPADRLELHWYEEGHCHLTRSWPLGADVGLPWDPRERPTTPEAGRWRRRRVPGGPARA